MKKLLSVILAVLVASLFIFPTCVLAAGDPTIAVSSATVSAGDSFEVAITLKDNPGITSMKLSIDFNNDAFTLEKVSYGEKFAGNAIDPQSLESPVTLNWVKGIENVAEDGEFATLSFTALKTASSKENIKVSYDPEDVHNINESDVAFKVTGGEITVDGAQGDTASGVTTIGATGDAAAPGEGEDTAIGANDDSGNYTGPMVDLDGNVVGDGTEETADDRAETGTVKNDSENDEENKAPIIWIFAVIAAVLLVAAVVLVIVKKRVTKKPLE